MISYYCKRPSGRNLVSAVCDSDHRMADDFSAQRVAFLHNRRNHILAQLGVIHPADGIVQVRVKDLAFCLNFFDSHLGQDRKHIVMCQLHAPQKLLIAATDAEGTFQRIQDRQQIGDTFDFCRQTNLFLFTDSPFAVVVKFSDLAQQLVFQ